MSIISVILFLFPLPIYFFLTKNIVKSLLIYTMSLLSLVYVFFLIYSLSRLAEHLYAATFKFFVQYYAWCTAFYFFSKTIKKSSCSLKKAITGYVFILFAVFLNLVLPWSMDNFPMEQPETVFFTLYHGVGGGITPQLEMSMTTKLFLPLLLLTLVYFLYLCYSKKDLSFISLRIGNLRIDFVVLCICFFLVSFANLCVKLKAWEYIDLLKAAKQPLVDSDFYKEEYINPAEVKLTFPEKKRNCIFILLESIESSFADTKHDGLFSENYIPKLTQMATENINFRTTQNLGGGYQLYGTGWTIAGILSKLGGVPFALNSDTSPQKLKSFLPNATLITDILAQNSYNQVFICGSDKGFASRDTLLETHGNVSVRDINWYKDNNRLDKNYHNGFWGFEDELLYKFAKEDLQELATQDNPFFMMLLTVDTHFPNGYKCNICPDEYSQETMGEFKNAMKCADNQIADFVDWIKAQPFYEDTLIVITGDHLFMTVPGEDLFADKNESAATDRVGEGNNEKDFGIITQSRRRWIDVFINSSLDIDVEKEKSRFFSSFDVFPTTLAAMGVRIEGDALGFGRSLFSQEPTLLEKYSVEYINNELAKNTVQYQQFIKDTK